MSTHFLAPQLAMLDLAGFMREALSEVEHAGKAGDLPIGAVLVIDGQIVSRGRSQQHTQHSQISHAELNALLQGGQILWEHYERAVVLPPLNRVPCV